MILGQLFCCLQLIENNEVAKKSIKSIVGLKRQKATQIHVEEAWWEEG